MVHTRACVRYVMDFSEFANVAFASDSSDADPEATVDEESEGATATTDVGGVTLDDLFAVDEHEDAASTVQPTITSAAAAAAAAAAAETATQAPSSTDARGKRKRHAAVSDPDPDPDFDPDPKADQPNTLNTGLSTNDLDAVQQRVIPPGGRKSKHRKGVSFGGASTADAHTAEVVASLSVRTEMSPPEPSVAAPRVADMPRLDALWNLDAFQTAGTYALTTEPPNVIFRSAAEAIRDSVRAEEQQRTPAGSSDSDPAASVVPVQDGPPPTANLTIEEFFSGDFTMPLVGYAADLHEVIARVKREMAACDAVASTARADVDRHAPSESVREAASVHLPPPRHPPAEAEAEADASASAAAADAGGRRRKKARTAPARPPGDLDDAVVSPTEKSGSHVEIARLEECTREWCSDFLREAREIRFGERPCRRGNNCVFMLIAAHFPDVASETASDERFIAREFLRPSEVQYWKNTENLPAVTRLCLGCNRLMTSVAYHQYRVNGEQPTELFQDHCNIIDTDGEYDGRLCLAPVVGGRFTGITMPIVEFSPHNMVPAEFEVVSSETGTTWIVKGVSESQADFRLRPSSKDQPVAERLAAAAARAEAETTGDTDVVATIDGEDSVRPSVRSFLSTAPVMVYSGNNGPPLARPRPPPPVWVSGPLGMHVGGVPAARPLRPADWIAAEVQRCPLAHGIRPLGVFTPRLLLGRLYPQDAPRVFCEFSETVRAVREHPRAFYGVLRVHLKYSPKFHSFERPVLDAAHEWILWAVRQSTMSVLDGESPAGATTGGKSYAILVALMYRVHMASRLVSIPSNRGAQSYWLQLFIDTHIDMAIAMREGDAGFFDDVALEDSMANPRSCTINVYDETYPHDMRALHSGDLPDISDCLQYGDIWYQANTRSFPGTIMEALVYLIVDKTQPLKCNVTNLAQSLYEYACLHPQLMTILRGILCVSLLGNYQHAEVRPDFATRLHIVHTFKSETTSDTDLFMWIYNYEGIVHAALKEYYRYMVSLRPGLEVVLLETTYWKTVSRTFEYGMDRVRSSLPLTVSGGTVSGLTRQVPAPVGMLGEGVHGRDPLGGGDATLHLSAMAAATEELRFLFERAVLPQIHKLRKLPLTETISQAMTNFFMSAIIDEHLITPQSSLASLAKIDGTQNAEHILREMRSIVVARVPAHHSRKPVELGWMSIFGVTPEGVATMRALMFDFEMKDIADNLVVCRIEAIYKHNKRDFFLMHIYFTLIQDRRSVQSFALPFNYVSGQSAALRAKWKVMPWRSLNREADEFYYCPACCKWLADTVDANRPRSSENMHSFGTRYALYSIDTGYLYCGMQKVSVNGRKQAESGRYEDPSAPVANITEARRVRHFLQTPSCAAMPAVRVRMIGRVQQLGNCLWALCTVCASLCPWDAHRFGPNGFTCGFHGDDKPLTLTVREEDREVERARRKRSTIHARCSYCHDQLSPVCDYTNLRVRDDVGEIGGDGQIITAPSYKSMWYTLCTTCGHAVHNPTSVLRSYIDGRICRLRLWYRRQGRFFPKKQ